MPDAQQTTTSIENAVKLPEPSEKTPIVAVASCEPGKSAIGDTFAFVIRARTLAGWHVYAVDRPTGISVPTTLELVLPPGVVAEGEWEYPQSEAYASDLGPAFVYEGEMAFVRTLRVGEEVRPGVNQIVCQFGFQACNSFSCLQPTTLRLTASVVVE